MKQYSVSEKLQGLDLHGLPCRIPEPTAEQAKCSHTRHIEVDEGYADWDGEWQSDWREYEVGTYEDVPGTNNFRCTQCGYTRRY
jgi:hypothetical protein